MAAEESKVLCHSSYRYDQRPYSFSWQGEQIPVGEVITEENTPQGRRFLVKTADGGLYSLEYFLELDAWQVRQA
jgi:hypothetical protein